MARSKLDLRGVGGGVGKIGHELISPTPNRPDYSFKPSVPPEGVSFPVSGNGNRLFVLERGLVTFDDPPQPVTRCVPVGVFSTELKALEEIELLDDGLGRHWTIHSFDLDAHAGGCHSGVRSFGQETWKSRLEYLRRTA